MIQRTLLEWKRIAYGECEDTIPESHAARLASVASASSLSGRGGGNVLDFGRKDLRARGFVGVIAAPGCQLEILPKIEGRGDKYTADTPTLRNRLVHMLAVARDIRVDTGGITQMDWQRDTLLEILIRLFCGKLADALRQGMPRRYIAHIEDLPAMRGRLDTNRQFTVLAAQPQKLACHVDELSPDIPVNQIMKATVKRLMHLAQATENQRSLRELAFSYADITDVPTTALDWDKIVLDRTNQRWQELLSLARLLLGRQYQKTSIGSVNGHALLFEMNVLFEEYVARLLKHALAGSGLRVSTQGGHHSCLFYGETGLFRTRPDIIVRRGDQIVLVVDTKWKRMAPRIDDPKQGVSQADVYQLMAYGRLYQCPRTMLLYPHHSDLDGEELHRNYSIAARDSDKVLTFATVDVSQNKKEVGRALAALVKKCLSP